ncbi:hypothetical protein IQ272_12300 [Chroococcidiopsidales cyanobacterium LEGE 13417]|nr:hypothetical protein [Chroococcidiopsidales cyanobacterium LEGE 13417]
MRSHQEQSRFALSRYYLGAWFVQLFGTAIPYGTIFINVSGCFGRALQKYGIGCDSLSSESR